MFLLVFILGSISAVAVLVPFRHIVVACLRRVYNKNAINDDDKGKNAETRARETLLNLLRVSNKVYSVSPHFPNDEKEVENKNDALAQKSWKSNILMEYVVVHPNTLVYPPENIVMYYDYDHRAFAYFSNARAIDYDTLNRVAAKYVHLYHCKEFFVCDDAAATDSSVSANASDDDDCDECDDNDSVFVKPKKNGTVANALQIHSKRMNTFIRVGPFRDFLVLNKSDYKHKCGAHKNIDWTHFKNKQNTNCSSSPPQQQRRSHFTPLPLITSCPLEDDLFH